MSDSSTNVISRFRRAIMAHLAENLQGGTFEVRAGERDGAAKKKLAVVFAPPLAEWANDINFVQPQLIVRAWLPQPSTAKASSPVDPEPVEQLLIDMWEVFPETVQTTLVDDLYFRVAQVEPDYEDWGVQATLLGWARNPAIA